MLEIIIIFDPLIKKYSRKLNYDGADTDLIIAFIEIIYKIPLESNSKMHNENCILQYIKVSIENTYIHLSKKYVERSNMEIQLDTSTIGVPKEESMEDYFYIKDLLGNLSKVQKKVIIELYLKDRTEKELAKCMHISKQAINKTKKRALSNLKKIMYTE